MKKILIIILLLPFSTIAVAGENSYFLTIGTGGISGTYYPVGVSIGKLINLYRKEHGIRVEAMPTGGSVANINEVIKGVDNMAMAIVQSDAQYNAYHGLGAFTTPQKNIRALFGLYSEAYTVVARGDAGIKEFEDIKGKRFNLGNTGSGTRTTTNLLLTEYGLTKESFAVATEYTPAEMVAALCDGKIDAFAYVIGNPNAAISEAITCGAKIVSVKNDGADKFVKKYPFFPKATIRAGTYKGSAEVLSVGPKATFITTNELPDAVAYEIVKTIYNNFDYFKQMHPALGGMRKEDLVAGNSVPYHPGAERFYKEVGLLR